jgi:transketolase
MAFGWKVIEVMRGNDIGSVISGLRKAQASTGTKMPVMVLLHTEMGNGVDFMMGSHKWHGIAPSDEQLAVALNQNAETLGDYIA